MTRARHQVIAAAAAAVGARTAQLVVDALETLSVDEDGPSGPRQRWANARIEAQTRRLDPTGRGVTHDRWARRRSPELADLVEFYRGPASGTRTVRRRVWDPEDLPANRTRARRALRDQPRPVLENALLDLLERLRYARMPEMERLVAETERAVTLALERYRGVAHAADDALDDDGARDDLN